MADADGRALLESFFGQLFQLLLDVVILSLIIQKALRFDAGQADLLGHLAGHRRGAGPAVDEEQAGRLDLLENGPHHLLVLGGQRPHVIVDPGGSRDLAEGPADPAADLVPVEVHLNGILLAGLPLLGLHRQVDEDLVSGLPGLLGYRPRGRVSRYDGRRQRHRQVQDVRRRGAVDGPEIVDDQGQAALGGRDGAVGEELQPVGDHPFQPRLQGQAVAGRGLFPGQHLAAELADGPGDGQVAAQQRDLVGHPHGQAAEPPAAVLLLAVFLGLEDKGRGGAQLVQ